MRSEIFGTILVSLIPIQILVSKTATFQGINTSSPYLGNQNYSKHFKSHFSERLTFLHTQDHINTR